MRDDTLPRRSDTPGSRRGRPSRLGWAVFAGSVAAMAVVFVVVTVGIGAVAGSYAVGALMGVFCAGWGGVGFGVMFSGALAVVREDEPR